MTASSSSSRGPEQPSPSTASQRAPTSRRSIALAASPSVYTVEYPGDTTASCQAAWAVLVSQLTGGTMFTNAIKDACSSAGYNASNAQN